MTPSWRRASVSRSFGHVRALDRRRLRHQSRRGRRRSSATTAPASRHWSRRCPATSTLDDGEIYFEGEPVTVVEPAAGRPTLGMEVVYQDLALAPHLNPVQNMFLGREISRKGHARAVSGSWTRRPCASRRGRVFAELGGTVRSLTAPVGSMSGGQRQGIAIARAIAWANKVVIPRRADRGAGRRPDQERAGDDQAGARQGHRGGLHRALDAARARGVLTASRCCGSARGSPPTRAKGTTVEELVGAMTGALGHEGRRRMSTT